MQINIRRIIPILFFAATLPLQAQEKTMPNAATALTPKIFFEKLDKNHMELVEQFYAPEIQFTDPVGEVKGVKAMRAYYEGLYRDVTSIRFEFHQEIRQDNEYIGIWTMYLAAPRLNGGKEIAVAGNSHIRFGADGKALYHRDYFDMGAFIYEQLPILKTVIKAIKRRLQHQG